MFLFNVCVSSILQTGDANGVPTTAMLVSSHLNHSLSKLDSKGNPSYIYLYFCHSIDQGPGSLTGVMVLLITCTLNFFIIPGVFKSSNFRKGIDCNVNKHL